MSEDKKRELLEKDLFASTASKAENKNENESPAKATSLFGASAFFASAKTMASSPTPLEDALKFFTGASVQVKQGDNTKLVQAENVKHTMDLTDKLIAELSAMTSKMKENMPASALMVDKYISFSQKYNDTLPKAKDWSDMGKYDNLEALQYIVAILKNHCDNVIRIIENAFNEHYKDLFEVKDENVREEIEQNYNTKFAEKELLISRYKTLFYEYILYFESTVAEARKQRSSRLK